MSNKTLFIAAALGLLALPCRAQTQPNDGRNAAFGVCGSIPFDDDKQACMRTVEGAVYFNAAAVGMCREIPFPTSKPACIAAIANKEFEPAELQACKSPFPDNEIGCFQTAGRPYVPAPVYEPRPNTDGHILRKLRRIQGEIRSGNIPAALMDLGELMEFVERGMAQ